MAVGPRGGELLHGLSLFSLDFLCGIEGVVVNMRLNALADKIPQGRRRNRVHFDGLADATLKTSRKEPRALAAGLSR